MRGIGSSCSFFVPGRQSDPSSNQREGSERVRTQPGESSVETKNRKKGLSSGRDRTAQLSKKRVTSSEDERAISCSSRRHTTGGEKSQSIETREIQVS